MSNTRVKELLLRSTILAGFAASSLAGLAAAQTGEEPEQTQPRAEEAEPAADRVVVTGSRIRRDAFSSEVPLEVYDADAAALRGTVDVADFLQSATVAAGSPQVTSATSSQFVQNGGIGAETLSLRGLGANRTLVLLNGRRAGPAAVEQDQGAVRAEAAQRERLRADAAVLHELGRGRGRDLRRAGGDGRGLQEVGDVDRAAQGGGVGVIDLERYFTGESVAADARAGHHDAVGGRFGLFRTRLGLFGFFAGLRGGEAGEAGRGEARKDGGTKQQLLHPGVRHFIPLFGRHGTPEIGDPRCEASRALQGRGAGANRPEVYE